MGASGPGACAIPGLRTKKMFMWFEWASKILSGWVQSQCDGFGVLGSGVEGVLQIHEERVTAPAKLVLDVGVQELGPV